MSLLKVNTVETSLVQKTGGTGSPKVRELPVFSVQRTTDQSITTGTWTKVNYNTVNFDSNGYWSAGNFRYTPLIPGYYVFNMELLIAGSSSVPTQMIAAFYKNGERVRSGSRVFLPSSPASSPGVVANSLIYMNGSTDFIEAWGFGTAGTPYVFGSNEFNYFEGFLLRPD